MKYCLIFFFFAFFFGCNNSNKSHQEVQSFYEFLGDNKATALELAMSSFHIFLEMNYPNQPTSSEKIKAFLMDLQSQDYTYILNLKYDIENIKNVVQEFEKTGLRKDIYLYPYEDYQTFNLKEFDLNILFPSTSNVQETDLDIMEMDEIFVSKSKDSLIIEDLIDNEVQKNAKHDSTMYFNCGGQFLYGLAKFNQSDTTLMEYVEIKTVVGDISFTLLSSGFLYNHPSKLDRPWLQIAIVAEIYLYFIYKKVKLLNRDLQKNLE